MDESDFMRVAIEKAREGIAAGQSPFGAVIVNGEHVLAAAHNTVWRDSDPTAHAEINAIRHAAIAVSGIDLETCSIFSTCEPCPMCLAAIHWSKIRRVVFGASISDAAAAGFSELSIRARTMAKMGGSPLKVEGGLLRDECRALFGIWKKNPSRKVY
ncbi:MAG TPA: nucleoside deaminase [Terriglobia bacterium]|nr:nucleoside deaminase [Terriglobia bacterium]